MDRIEAPQRTVIDLDGVLAAFVEALLDLLRERGVVDFEIADWTRGVYCFEDVLGVSNDRVWQCIEEAGAGFWARLPHYPWAGELCGLAQDRGDWVVVSQPGRHPSSAAGKLQWLHEKFAGTRFNYFLGPPKWLLARWGTLLIDDCDENVDKFRKHGGAAILFPQPWNSNWDLVQDRMQYVHDELAALDPLD